MTSTTLKVAAASTKAAQFAVKHWHYSKSMPVSPRVIYGVWEGGKFIGVVIFSRGASPALGAAYKLSPVEVCELTRVALATHQHPVTQIVSTAIRLLKRDNPGLRLIVSFADPAQGHKGGIYQAGNWIYTGCSDSAAVYYDRDGRKWHNRQVSRSGVIKQFGKVRPAVRIAALKKVMQPGKHRYLMPLDKQIGRRVEKLRQPYPDSV